MALTDRELTLQTHSGRLVFASDVLATLVLNAVQSDEALPSVTVPSGFLPSGASIDRVLAGISWRKQVDSSGSENAVDGATQEIQVRDDTPGTYRTAIDIPDNSLATAADATEGGILIIGDNDISWRLQAPTPTNSDGSPPR